MNITKNIIPIGSNCDTGEYFKEGHPASVTIHWIGPYPGQTPTIVRDWWINSKGEASAHFVIKDDECVQCWPGNKIAWHAGCKIGNESSIGIEIIPENKKGKFSEKSIKTLKKLLDTKFSNLPIMRHYDWTGKDCPKYYITHDKWVALLAQLDR